MSKKDKEITRTHGLRDMKPGQEKDKRVGEKVELLKLNPDFQQVRLVGEVWPYAQHWIDIKTKKGIVSIPKTVPNFNPGTDTFDDTMEDPYQDISNPLRTSKRYYVNCIVRSLQEEQPKKAVKASKEERKSGFKTMESKAWTPIRVLSFPSSVARKLQALILMNKHKVGKKLMDFDLVDPEYGMDVYMRFNPEEAGSAMYDVQKGDHSPLTEKEKDYLMWDISNLMEPEPLEEAKKEAKQLEAKDPGAEGEDEDTENIEDYLSAPTEPKVKSKKKKKKKKADLHETVEAVKTGKKKDKKGKSKKGKMKL